MQSEGTDKELYGSLEYSENRLHVIIDNQVRDNCYVDVFTLYLLIIFHLTPAAIFDADSL